MSAIETDEVDYRLEKYVEMGFPWALAVGLANAKDSSGVPVRWPAVQTALNAAGDVQLVHDLYV